MRSCESCNARLLKNLSEYGHLTVDFVDSSYLIPEHTPVIQYRIMGKEEIKLNNAIIMCWYGYVFVYDIYLRWMRWTDDMFCTIYSDRSIWVSMGSYMIEWLERSGSLTCNCQTFPAMDTRGEIK